MSKKGYKQTKEHIKKRIDVRIKNNTYKFSEEHKKKISETKKRLYAEGKLINPMKGKPKSEETRKKIGLAGKGRIPWNKGKTNIYSQQTIDAIKRARAKQIFPIKESLPEIKIQNFLKQLGINFFTHQYINIEHGYQCDILIPSLNMVIECDGIYWRKYPIGREIDHIRTSELINKGFKVLRLWENEIKEIDIEKFKLRLEIK